MRLPFLRINAVALVVCMGIGAAQTAASPGAKLSYRRVFKSSVPEFIQISVHDDSDQGSCEIRQLDEDPETTACEVGPAVRAKMFLLAAQLNHFNGKDLDVHRKIANLGEKTFRWESGKESHEVKFNYTLDTAASQLLQLFEGLARQQELLVLLQRRMKYDRLGINDAIMQFERDYDKGVLPEPQRALPLLEQIAADSRFVEIARQRCRALAERLRHARQLS